MKQRLADLEQQLNGNTPRLTDAEARLQRERDLAEIQRLGLVERAQQDFTSRTPGATIEQWMIGYVFNTNVVWCDVRYRVPGSSALLQKEFGYRRTNGTNWSLMWDMHPKH